MAWININEGLPKPDQVVEIYSRHPHIRWQTAQFREMPNGEGFLWVATLNMDFPIQAGLKQLESGEFILQKIQDWRELKEPPAYPVRVIRDDTITGKAAKKAG